MTHEEIKERHDETGSFREGLARAKPNGKRGFIAAAGKCAGNSPQRE